MVPESVGMDDIRIFISYARADGRELALRLYDDVRAAGHAVWLDTSEVSGGENFAIQIEQAIDECDVVLALLSHGSYKSEYCRREHMRAVRKGKRIIPLRVQVDTDIPLYFESLNYLDFANLDRYDDMLRDLLSDITAGQAFRGSSSSRDKTPSEFFKPGKAQKISGDEKRDSAAFRRHIAELRHAPWLGARYWWPYFLFTYENLPDVVEVLSSGTLRSPQMRDGSRRSRWDETVQLHFRPRTPETWYREGIRPAGQRKKDACSIPVYLLFDLESVILMPETRFSTGDPAKTKKTYAMSSAFAEMPFHLIYHDSFVRTDEKDEILSSRKAQVVVPNQLSLEALQVIWCRSDAEYDTLRHLLPDDVWRKWRDKITARTDYTLFHRRWAYVDTVLLTNESIHFRFNRNSGADTLTFDCRVEVEEMATGKVFAWYDDQYRSDSDLIIELTDLTQPEEYIARLYLDDTLAYANRYQASDGLL